ncbi:MAG: xylulokinase [Opitutaceae bacterium]|nr:xylulokinase [Opitutaceae bacterium]
MSLYIGVDSGTQSTKAVVLDLSEGRIIAEASVQHVLIAGLPAGHMEQNPQEWTVALDSVILELGAKIDRRRVRGIGVSGQQHGLVPLDAGCQVIRPAKLWCDTSTVKECELLTKKFGGVKAVIRKVGLPFLPGYTAPKILWLKRHEPGNYRRLRHILLPHDYLNLHLTGSLFMEYGDASGTALLDVRRRAWSCDAIAAIDKNLVDWLPPLSSSHEAAGKLRPALARKYGLSADVLVSAGGGDNMMGAIGTGNVVPGIVTASFGTSGTIYAFSERPVIDPRGEIAAFCSSTGGWLPLLCTMNVTLVTEGIRALFSWDHASFDQAVAGTAAGAEGLTLIPYFNGERTPDVPRGTGVLYGLNCGTLSSGHLARAAMEGVTLGMNYGLRRLVDLGIKPKEIRLTGGGAKSAV